MGEILPLQVGAIPLPAEVGPASRWGSSSPYSPTAQQCRCQQARAKKQDTCPAVYTCQSQPATAKSCPGEQGVSGWQRSWLCGTAWHDTLAETVRAEVCRLHITQCLPRSAWGPPAHACTPSWGGIWRGKARHYSVNR